MPRTVLLLALTAGCAASPPADGPATGSPGTGSPDPVECTPPPLQSLDGIPDSAALARAPGAVLAAFEVDGDQLVAKHVVDPVVAEGALQLWQELVLRIPRNQRAQLVQLTMVESDALAAWVDNSGTANQVGRYGPGLYLNASNIDDNDPDVCAPLSGHRGTFDWTLVHELGHLRQYADGAVDDFVERFSGPTGDGEGYPDDGTPRLDGDFVTSYAERSGGDEDAAESFTAWVMLDLLPTEDSLAADKVRFFEDLRGYPELRRALRVTEPGGGGVDVPAAPLHDYDLEIDNPDWLIGSWEGAGPEGPVAYEITADDVVLRQTVGADTLETRYSALRDDGTLATIEVVESSEAFHFHQLSIGGDSASETFQLQGQTVLVEREGLGTFTVARAAR